MIKELCHGGRILADVEIELAARREYTPNYRHVICFCVHDKHTQVP